MGLAHNQCQRLPPFQIKIRHIELIVELAETGVKELILLMLPVGAGGVAEEEAAAEGADGVDGAEFVFLEGAAGRGWEGGRIGGWEVVEEGGQFHGGDVEAVAEFFEAAAAAGDDAGGAAEVDLGLEVGVDLLDGDVYVGARGGGENCFLGFLKLGVGQLEQFVFGG